MAVSPSCIAAVREASGNALSDAEATALIRRMEQRKAAFEADGRLDGLDARLREAAAEEADNGRVQAALSRKHAALNAIVRDRIETQVGNLVAGGMDFPGAVLAVFEGTTRNIAEGRSSVHAAQLAYQDRYMGALMGRVEGERRQVLGLLRSDAFQSDVVREMVRPGSTGNTDAAWTARLFADVAEQARLDLNRLGANIGKLDGWAGPQSHDPVKMTLAGQDRWVRVTSGLIDAKRSFPDAATPDEVAAILREVWTTNVTGRDRASTAAGRGEVTGPANLAATMGEHRVLHFSDADAWLAYQREFGNGHVFPAMVAHLRRAGQVAGLMDKLGPNPEVMLASLMDSLQGRVRGAVGAGATEARTGSRQVAALSLDGSAIRQALDTASGATMRPVSQTAAQIGGSIRAVQSMAKLGGAVISSLSDMVTRAANLTWQGKPLLETYADQVADIVRGRGAGEQREVAYLLGEGFDGLIGHVISPYVAGDTMPGTMHRLSVGFFRASGLTWWTDAMRASHARMLSAWMGQRVQRSFDKLDPAYRNALSVHGIDGPRWAAIRQAKFRAVNGNIYVTPERIADLPDAVIAPLVEADAPSPRQIADARLDLEMRLRGFFADEMGFGVIESGAADRRFLLRGTRPGTATGELLRFIAQFKGFPTAFTQRVLGRAVFGAPGDTALERLANNAGHIGHLIAGLTVAGYASMTAKDLLAGREPRDPAKSATWRAALMQGGGAGIYGDFLFAQANRFGGGTLETLAGPTIGTGSAVIDLWLKARDGEAGAGEALNLALQNTPYANLWYARPVLDVLVLNSMRESLSPGFLARQERERRKSFGQEHWAPRTLF